MSLLSSLSQVWRRPPAPRPPLRPATGQWYQREAAIMGTRIQAELWAETSDLGEEALDAVMAEMHRIDAAMSPHRDSSELSRINREAGQGPVPLSEEMTALLGRALQLSDLSGGAFDISYAAVGQHYDYRQGVAPDARTLRRARTLVNYRHLMLDMQARTLQFGMPGMRIDLGGFAKGHAVNNAVRQLRKLGIAHAMVAAGGDSYLLGDRRGRPWTVAVRDPRRVGEAVAVLPLQDVAVSTSGDYERFFERDGVRHHHLIDPRTGESPRHLHSVTILADEGLMSEALSKTVFVLGLEAGLRLIERLPGIDAVVVDAQGRMHASSGLMGPAH